MYPILCPVVAPPVALLNLGALDRSLSIALNLFGNQTSGLSFPLISADWERISGFNMGSADVATLLASLRRLGDAADMLGSYHRELAARIAPAATSKISQHGLEAYQADQTRLKEIATKPVARKSDSPAPPPKSRWQIAAAQKGQGQIFLNDDGRAIHLNSPAADAVVFGYGWHTGLMHYMEINAHSSLNGRSLALFISNETRPSDFSPPYFAGLVQAMMDFYTSAIDGPANQLLIKGTDLKHQPFTAEGSAADMAFLSKTYRSLSLAHNFTVETLRVVDGSRNPTFKSVSPAVAMGQFSFIAATNRVITSLYRSPKSAVTGEMSLSPEQRKHLVFPKPLPRPPSRLP